eukprot:GHVU01012517.1.p1 GENE.GHVU01012517.1~~GHVU01012517.1.p1  ORF type:complete len:477 (-),score=113.41 GHVU01012517.1:29-1309(-)
MAAVLNPNQLTATVLQANCWPIQSEPKVMSPSPQFGRLVGVFTKFYTKLFPARRLSWHWRLGTCEVAVHVPGERTRMWTTAPVQAMLLLQFNGRRTNAVSELVAALGATLPGVAVDIRSLTAAPNDVLRVMTTTTTTTTASICQRSGDAADGGREAAEESTPSPQARPSTAADAQPSSQTSNTSSSREHAPETPPLLPGTQLSVRETLPLRDLNLSFAAQPLSPSRRRQQDRLMLAKAGRGAGEGGRTTLDKHTLEAKAIKIMKMRRKCGRRELEEDLRSHFPPSMKLSATLLDSVVESLVSREFIAKVDGTPETLPLSPSPAFASSLVVTEGAGGGKGGEEGNRGEQEGEERTKKRRRREQRRTGRRGEEAGSFIRSFIHSFIARPWSRSEGRNEWLCSLAQEALSAVVARWAPPSNSAAAESGR